MISFFRKWLTSWPVIALLVLVAVAFVVTGVGDPFGGGGSSPGASIATVGDAKLGQNDLLQRYDQIVRRERETNPAVTPQALAAQGAVEQVYEQLVAATALEQFANRIGLVVSDRAVDGEIASVPAFQVAGKFDQPTYQRALAAQRLSERELRDSIRGDLLRQQLLVPVLAGAQTPRSLAAPYARLLLDVHRGSIALVPFGPPPPAPSQAELESFYRTNIARFTLPERRSFRYALVQPAAAAAPTEAEIAAFYKANLARFGGLEQRELLQVVLPDEAAARAFAAAVRAGESFAAAAARLAQASATDIAVGTLTETAFAKATSPAVARAAFAAASGTVTAPVRSDFGWHVVSPVRVVAAQSQGLAGARAAITAELSRAKAGEGLADTVARIEDGIAEGSSFADLAREFRLSPVTVPPVTGTGQAATLAPEATPLVSEAFKGAAGDEPAVVDIGGGRFALFELGEITPPTPQPLAAIAGEVRAVYAEATRRTAARKVAEAIAAEVQRGTPLAQALASRRLPPALPVAARPIDVAQQPQVGAVVRAFLTLPASTTRAMPDEQGRGYVVMHVAAVEPGRLEAAPQLLDSARSQFAQSAPEELATAFARAVEGEVKVQRNAQALAAVKSRIVGDNPAQ